MKQHDKLQQAADIPAWKTIIDAYLSRYTPAETYDESCDLMDTKSIIFELEGMYNFDINTVADYIASLGYRFHFTAPEEISGWILKRKPRASDPRTIDPRKS